MRVILDGDPNAEHIWVEARADSVTFGLHTYRITAVDVQPVDRTLLTVPREALEALLQGGME